MSTKHRATPPGISLGERNWGVSIISFFPLFLLPFGWGYRIAQSIATRAGMSLQVLPTRGLSRRVMAKLDIISYESAWRKGTWREAWSRLRGAQDRHLPSFVDLLLFGSQRAIEHRVGLLQILHPCATPIDLADVPRSSMELGPEAYDGRDRQWGLRVPAAYVLDTLHITEMVQQPNFNLSPAEIRQQGSELLNGIRPTDVSMIHVQIRDKDEFLRFLNETSHSTTRMMLRDVFRRVTSRDTPIVIELSPILFWKIAIHFRSPSRALDIIRTTIARTLSSPA